MEGRDEHFFGKFKTSEEGEQIVNCRLWEHKN